MKYILAHDFGTSADKAAVFTVEGELVATRTTSYPTVHNPGRQVEQNARDWWRVFCENTKALVSKLDPADILCVSFSGTSPNCLCVDHEGQPLHKAMIWQDNRAVAEAEELTKTLPAASLERHPGHRMSTDRTLPKLLWVKRNLPRIYESTWKVLPSVNSYIILRITGRAVCDPGVARTTAMATADCGSWDDDILNAAGLSRNILPYIVGRTDVVGVIPRELSEACGLAPGTAVVAGTIDNACTQLGAGILRANQVFICGGTSASVEGFDQHGERIGRPTSASGGSLNWLKNHICHIERVVAEETNVDVFDIINAKASRSPVGSNGVIFHPYLAGARSVLDNPNAKGAFLGLSLDTGRDDMIRAVIEGIGFNLNLILQMMRDRGMTVTRMPIVGGLGKGAVTRQIFADIMDVELVTYDYLEETSAIGAAVLGGIAVGAYENEDAVSRFIRETSVTRPIPENVAKYRRIIPVYRALYNSLASVYDQYASAG